MEDIKRPKFIKNFITLLFVIVPAFIGYISNVIPAVSEIKIWIFSLNILITFGIIIIGLIIYIVIYIHDLNKYCTIIENNNTGLKNDNSLIKEKNIKLENERNNTISLITEIVYHLRQGTLNITNDERKYLKSLLSAIDCRA